MQEDRILYFAYGSNMDKNQMKDRCPEHRFISVAILEGYKLVYDGYSSIRKGAVANIVESPDEIVYGVLYEISKEDKERLDRFEGVPDYYKIKNVKVKDREGKEYIAITYYREPLEEGLPSEEYQNTIVDAAIELGFPQEYIEKYLKKR